MIELSTWQFQTPEKICKYMINLLPQGISTVLEPTAGKGNLVRLLHNKGINVDAPKNIFGHCAKRYDAVVMNPPFTPMFLGYKIFYLCMDMSNIIIALMPWLTIINSQKRTTDIVNFGLKSITHLPRSTFKGARVQTCILEMVKGYKGITKWSAI